jgi:hypothetical protein
MSRSLFMDLVCCGGTPSADCQFCGRLHFATGPGSCEATDEIERLRALAKESPDRYCESDDDAIAIGVLDGMQVVWNCPCDTLLRYEQFIWDNRVLIAKYIKARTLAELESASGLLGDLAAQPPGAQSHE